MSTIYNSNGWPVAYKCNRCGNVVHTMWGDVCNACRSREKEHDELIAKIDKLTEALKTKQEPERVNNAAI